jgi:hypothetical protein
MNPMLELGRPLSGANATHSMIYATTPPELNRKRPVSCVGIRGLTTAHFA